MDRGQKDLGIGRYANRLDETEISGKSDWLFIRILVAESTHCDEWEYKLRLIQIEAFRGAQKPRRMAGGKFRYRK